MPHAEPLRLREDLVLDIVYADDTPYGSGVSGLSERFLRRSCAALEPIVAREGLAGLEAQAERLMPEIMSSRGLGGLYQAPRTLREHCVHPPADQVFPAALDVGVPHPAGRRGYRFGLQGRRARSLAGWLGEWQRGARRPRNAAAANMWDTLHELGALEAPRPRAQPVQDGVTLVGHATVAVQHQGTQILVDPFLLPPSADDPAGVRPHTACDLQPDAVFITHSHPDHYDLATLLRLGRDVPIVVPETPRESLLATDMQHRLQQLGFRAVRTLAWHDATTVGPLRVVALPFFGEQPSRGAMLHPSARNQGNTYVVEAAGRRIALLADAGQDAAGSTVEMAAAAHRTHGAVDLLFGGFRGWRVQPIRYLFSSVARYLLFVPPEDRTRWQQIMNDAADLVTTGLAWGASAVVPYANGGAPWFERIGLGPQTSTDHPDDPRVDPPVEAVAQAFEARPVGDMRLLSLDAGQCVHWSAMEASP